jgi:hypothetical protein
VVLAVLVPQDQQGEEAAVVALVVVPACRGRGVVALHVILQAAHMVAAEARDVLTLTTAVLVQCALFTPAIPVHSHQLVQEICNEPLH